MKLAVRSSVLFAAALMAATQIALAQVPGSLYGKTPRPVIEALTAGNPQDVIVVFDDKPTLKEARALELATGHDSRHSRVIEFKAGRYAEQKKKILSAFTSKEAVELKHFSHLPVGFVRVHTKAALEKLLSDPGVVGVFENEVKRATLAGSLPLIGQPQVAAQGYQGTGTTVAVLDTGTDYRLAAFGNCTSPSVPVNCKVATAVDFIASDGQLDTNQHGTNVAGIVLGVAPGAKIASLRVLDAAGNGSDFGILNAINWCIQNKVTYNIVAMNLSLGDSTKYTSQITASPYFSAFSNARAAGILPIVAAGNEAYNNGLASPGAVTGAVSVGAVYDSAMGSFNWGSPLRCTDTTSAPDKVVCFSNSASFLTLLAPGSQITAAGITQGGTSQAAPHVAGAVAVLRAAFPGETLDQTVARLTTGVMVTDSRNDITKPRLNLQMAMGLSAPCAYAVSSTSASHSAANSSGSVSVATAAECPWSAASSASSAGWIAVISGSSGSGNGAVSYSVSANPNVTARSGTLTVAGQTFAITQSGSVGASANILLNPDFESGPVSWTESTAIEYPVVTAYVNPVTNNGWYAWLCGYYNCVDTLYQDVTIPADATSAYLQFEYQIATDETSTFTAYDKMQVRVYSPPTASTYTHHWTLSNLNATTGWALSPQYDVSAFKGQAVRVQFSATTDASLTTSFYLDNVNLTVSGSSPDVQAPTVPTGLLATAISGSAISLSWSASTDNRAVAAYKIYRDGALLATLGNVRAYSDTGLTASTTYSYTVSACDAAGNCSLQSTASLATTAQIISDTQSPTMPTGITATAISTSAINLTWVASTDNVGVTTYKVYRSGTLLATLGNVTSYGDTGLIASTSYSYTVSACDLAGNCSAQSTVALATTNPPFTQASPIIFEGGSTYQPSGNSVTISINKITNRSLSRTSGSLKIELWALDMPYSFGGSAVGYRTASIRTNLVPGLSDQLSPNTYFSGITLNLSFTAPPANYTNYALFLLEYDPANCSSSDGWCTISYLNYHETQPPTVPANLTATAVSSSQTNLSWSPSTDNVGVATYNIYRGGTLVAILGNVTSYSDIGLVASAAYSYTVAACDAWQNCSAQSVAAVVTTPSGSDIQPPSVPTGLTATVVSSTQINLSWNASTDNAGVSAYKIYSSGGLVATLGNVTATSRTNVPSTTYSYTVSACDAAGNCSARSVAATATTPAPSDTQAPTIPTGLTATATSASTINLSWTAATDNVGVTSYKLYRGGTLLVTLGNLTSYGDSSLRDSTAYNYTVAACDALSNCSAQSIAATATTQGAVGPTLNLVSGWNLLGNSVNVPQSVSTMFDNAANVSTVWKWTGSKWAFYTPLQTDGGAAYAASKGYDFLTTINGGEGFWVNAKAEFTAQLPAGTSVLSSNFQDQATPPNKLPMGWSLIAIGDNKTPSDFNKAISISPPAIGTIPLNITTLWAWDSTAANWYFYAPSLEANGGLTNYISGKGYLDFGIKTLTPTTGFWVNKP